MTDLHPDSAERHLQRQLQIQREALRRKGADPKIILREITGPEAAVRGELWYLILTGGAAWRSALRRSDPGAGGKETAPGWPPEAVDRNEFGELFSTRESNKPSILKQEEVFPN
jgi:hypothetical protein